MMPMSRLLSVSTLIAVLLAVGPSACADSKWGADAGGDTVSIEHQRWQAKARAEAAQAGISVPRLPAPAEVVFPACLGNDASTGMDAMCAGVEIGCPPGTFWVWVFQAPPGSVPGAAGWNRVGERCSNPVAVGQVTVPTVLTEAAFRALPLPPGAAALQPPTGWG